MNIQPVIRVYPSPDELAREFANELRKMINSSDRHLKYTIALAGGSTPELLYSVLGDHFAETIEWGRVAVFWGDERCVPSDHDDSNYKMAYRTLLSKVNIDSADIHRIIGENDPASEALRYSREIKDNTKVCNGLPRFDLLLLGLGDDGHTASIFPDRPDLFSSIAICDVAIHPLTGQERISITGPVLNNSETVVFLVTGGKKAGMVRRILDKEPGSKDLPASRIVPSSGNLIWLLDREAANGLKI